MEKMNDLFCGEEGIFWDLNLTWYSSKPDFTSCFKDTALLWIPTAIFWLIVPFDLVQLYQNRGYPCKSHIARFQLACLIISTFIFSCLVVVKFIFWRLGETIWFWWGFSSYLLYGFTLISMTLLCLGQMRAGFTGSGAMWLSLLVSLCCGTVRLIGMIIGDDFIYVQSKEQALAILFLVYYICIWVTLVAFSFSSIPVPPLLEETNQKPFPEDFCSFPNKFTFSWAVPKLVQGYRRDLEMKDLWALHPQEKTAYLISHFEKDLRSEFAPIVESKRFSNTINSEFPDGATLTIKTKIKGPSIMKILIRQFGVRALVATIIQGVYIMLTFVEPIFVGLLTSFASNIHSEPFWHGFVYAGVLSSTLFVRGFIENSVWFRMVRLGRNVNAAFIACIYRKALKLTSEARKSSTVGEIVNIMSVDAERFYDFAVDFNNILFMPLQLIIGSYIAYYQVGVAVFSGLGYMLVISILNGFNSRLYERFQEQEMELKDERVKLLTEILNGMKVIKLYGWEPPFQRRLDEIRARELKVMRFRSYIGGFYNFTWNSTPLLASLIVLATYVAMSPDHLLKAEVVFVVLSVFNLLAYPFTMLPAVLAHLAMIRVSMKRMIDFFSGQEIEEDQVGRETSRDFAAYISNGTFAWDSTTGPILHDITMEVPRGKLVAIVGKVGAGKSSIIGALCGEMHKISGVVYREGSIGYVSQQAWIQNMTIKDNILFGKALNERRYNKIIDACSLRPDLESLPAHDQTEIGERGINLSGGQKQRVNLARAVYQNADLYLLDDPLSAVDVHVGKHIFEHVVGPNGILKDKTRILVTHALKYLPECDLVFVVADGRIQESGTFRDLVGNQGAFADFVQQYITQASVEELEELRSPEFETLESLEAAKTILEQRLSRQKTADESGKSSPQALDVVFGRLTSMSSDHSERHELLKPSHTAESGKLIDEELMEIGQVSWKVYLAYIKAAGAGLLLFGFFVMASHVFSMLGNIWLQVWTDNSQSVRENRTTEAIPVSKGLLYLGLCGAGQMFFDLTLGVVFAVFQIKAASLIHTNLLSAILKAPMSFFDTTPAGRIVNRCGKDINVIDSDVPGSLDQFITFLFNVIYSLVGLFIYVPIFGGILVPAAIVFYLIQKIYMRAARRVRRLEAITSSPIYSHFQESLQGVTSIRAFDQTDRFARMSDQLTDLKFSAAMARSLFTRWVSIATEVVTDMIITATAFSVVYMVINGQMSAGVAGLSLSSFVLHLPGILAWGIYVASALEMELVSMERIVEYSNVKPEAPWAYSKSRCSPSWPTNGRIKFNSYCTRYREGLPLILREFTANVEPMEKVGIVGRTGAGKSSLTLALFRIIEAAEGRIIIDDIDISTLGLHELRRKLTIIPQDAVLFSGSLRMNLDPFDQYTDDELWLALERSHLKDFVSSLKETFQHQVDEGGSNLSVGQRQLLCLARALLRKSKILILDEATAAVDVQTDSMIQATIRDEFKDCTILTIAHRLNTILDSDKIMVLDNGEMVECDTPSNLASREDSIFAGMLKEAKEGKVYY